MVVKAVFLFCVVFCLILFITYLVDTIRSYRRNNTPNMVEITRRVIDIVSKVSCINRDHIDIVIPLYEQGIDSIDIYEIIGECESEFGVVIVSKDEYSAMKGSVVDISEIINRRLKY